MSSLNKEENKRDTIVDRVFRKALQEFHVQLISSYSVLMKVYQAWHSNTSFFVRYLSAIQSTKYSVLQLYVAFSFLARQIVNSELWRLDGSVWIHSDKDDQKRTHQCQFSSNSGCERFRRGAVRVHRVKVIDFLVCHSITSHSTRYNC